MSTFAIALATPRAKSARNARDRKLAATLFAGGTNNAPDRFIGHPVIACDLAQWLVILHNTAQHGRPFLSRNPATRFSGTWVSRHYWHGRMPSILYVLLKKPLELLVEEAGGAMVVH